MRILIWRRRSSAEAPAATPRAAARPATATAWSWLGTTTDDPNADTAAQVDALAALPRRIALRVVLDRGTPPTDYVASVRRLAAVADVMALPLIRPRWGR